MIKKLSDMTPGQTGIIQSYTPSEIYLKLMEMGCVPGERVTIDKITSMGDPISISVAGYHLSLRLNEAEYILVETN